MPPVAAARLNLPLVPHYDIPLPSPSLLPMQRWIYADHIPVNPASNDIANRTETGGLVEWADRYAHVFSIIGSLGFLVSSVSLAVAVIAAKQSIRGHEFKTVSDISTGLSGAWLKLKEAETDRKYQTAELLNEYERTCSFINRKIVGKIGRAVLGEMIADGIIVILDDDELSTYVKALKGNDRETFKEIITFCNTQNEQLRNHPILLAIKRQE
jgi:hypothetical protein